MVEPSELELAEGPVVKPIHSIVKHARKIGKRIPLQVVPLGMRSFLRIGLIVAATGVVAWHLYLSIFQSVSADAVGNALGSMSVVGSIITGLCITGVSAMDGGLLKRLTLAYGEHLRAVFFVWFTFVSAVLIAGGVLHAIPDSFAARITAAFLPPVLFVAVTGLAFSVFKLYREEDEVILEQEKEDNDADG